MSGSASISLAVSVIGSAVSCGVLRICGLAAGGLFNTVTLKEPLAILPVASVAVAFTGVVPRGKIEPLAGTEFTTGFASKASVAVTEKFKTAPLGPVAAKTFGPGKFRLGAVRSTRTELLSVVAVMVLPAFPAKSWNPLTARAAIPSVVVACTV